MLKKFLASAVTALCLSSAVVAQSGLSSGNVATVDVLPGWRTAEGTRMTALRIQLAPGWKTYWRAPGEAGIPLRFDWDGSRNISAVAFHWPTPHIFEQNGLRTVGYKNELVLPMELTPGNRGQDIALQAEVEIGVCQDVCIPIRVSIATDLDGSTTPDTRISSAMKDRPMTAREAGLRTVTCGVEPIRDGLRLTAEIDMPRLSADEMAVFELSDQSIWIAGASAVRNGGTLTATTEMVPPSARPFMLDRSDIRITVLGADRAVDIRGCQG